MFGFSLSGLKEHVLATIDAQLRILVGVGFVAMAMAAIEYDEIIAPSVSKISGAWGSVASDLGRKVSSLAL